MLHFWTSGLNYKVAQNFRMSLDEKKRQSIVSYWFFVVDFYAFFL